MRKIYLTLASAIGVCVTLSAQETVFPLPIDETNFPDKSFRTVLLTATYDRDGDGMLSQEEAERVTELTMNYKYPHIADLTGIGYFVNLKSLSVQGNDLTAIDLSKNTKLTYLNVNGNKFTTIDFSDCPSLEAIICNSNKLTELKLAGNPALRRFECNSTATLTSLDVSKNPELDSLCCYSDGLTEIDVTANPKLRYLNVSGNKLTELNLTANPALKTLYCGKNIYAAGTLDLSKNPLLDELDCQQSELTSLDFTANPALRLLTCSFNNMTSLDLTANPALYKILVSYNKQMQTLTLGDKPELYDLQLGGCDIPEIDLSATPKLNSLNFQNCHLRRIDLSKVPDLKSLTCGNDSLVALDLGNVYLTYSGLRYAKSHRTVTLVAGNKFDMSTLAADGLDISRVQNVTGGTLDGNILSFSGDLVTYQYVTNSQNANYPTLTVQLHAVNFNSEGIDDLIADSAAPVEYYNLQGVRVDRPSAGNVYIRVQGGKATKVRM